MAKKDYGLTPAAGYLLIEPEESLKQTSSGIVLPESHDEKPQTGKILAVGEDELLESGKVRKSPVKNGDIVVYKKWGGNEYKVEGKELLFIKFEDILAIVEGK
jgi:chaperonin GroES